MDNENNAKQHSIYSTQKILRYPLNGRSSYLIDKFFIFGYDYPTLKKYLNNSENIQNIISENDRKQSRISIGDEELKKFHFTELPILINEFTSDLEKECLDIDMIREMIIPKHINLFYSEEEKSNEKKIKKRQSSSVEKYKIDEQNENFFCIYDESENYYNKDIKQQSYNVIFSSNPQSGNNSKKSINGFAYIFYKKLKEQKYFLNKYYSFYIPIIFCIISEFPFYNSFHQLCEQISCLFSSYEIRIPLEIIIHNIVNITPSPLNSDVYICLKSINNMDISANNQYKRVISDIQEEDDSEEKDSYNDSDKKKEKNNYNYNYNDNTNKDNKDNNLNSLMSQITYRPYERKSDKILSTFNLNDQNITNTGENQSGFKFDENRRNRRTVIVKKGNKKSNNNSEETYRRSGVSNIFKHLKTSSMNFLGNIITTPNSDISKKIKFEILTGYPVIQYNLAKVLLQTLTPIDIIVIFLYTFLEKDVLFFSKNLEFLSLTINSYLNLNFPLNDEKYYFINACVSYENYINANSTFVGSTFTTIIGINDSYNQKYQSGSMNKLKDHLAVDLDNGKVYKVEDKNDKENSKKNKELFSFIKNICKNRESRREENILYREIYILNQVLTDIYSKMKDNNDEDNMYYNIYKLNKYISYDKNIKSINLKIQDSFYRFINNISLYFYQNLSIKTEADDIKKQSYNKDNNKEEEMNVIFLDQYKEDNTYSKEEMYLLDELVETMKFQSFVFGFVQSYNPIDLYKIPLTFTEEFISIISRKSCFLDKDVNFLSLIDKLYGGNTKGEITIDFETVLVDFYTNYKVYFDREIEDIYEQNILWPEKIKVKVYNSYKKIIKYKGYELDNKILVKYLHILNELDDQKGNLFSALSKRVKENIPKTISVTDIESVIENYAIETGILSENDLCCANIIILFTLSLRSLKSIIDYQSFLGTLFQSFTVFRKYYSMIMSMIYVIVEKSIEKNNFKKAKDYYYLYYLCINSFRNFKLIPNESLMNIIKKFNKINIDSYKEENCTPSPEKKVSNTKIKLYGVNLPEDDITNKNLYLTHNFSYARTYKEKEIIDKVNDPNNNGDFFINIDGNETLQPKIKFNNGIHFHQSFFYSQRILLSTLVEDYNNYIIDMNEDNLRSKIILDACLNIFIFMRNSKEFLGNSEIFYTVKKIFYIFLNQFQIMKEIK